MNLAEKIRALREAAWTSPDELRAFVQAAHPTPPGEIEKLLAVLLEAGAATQGGRHVNRCSAFRALANASADASLFAPLARALVPADPVARKAIAAILPKANDVNAHRVLCEVLGSADADVRAHAAQVLEQVGGPSALAALEKLVVAREFAGREEAMRVMIERARHRAVGVVAAVVAHGNRKEQVIALRHFGTPVFSAHAAEVVPHVRLALRSPDPAVLTEALRLLHALLPDDAVLDELAGRISAPECDPALIDTLGTMRSAKAAAILASRLRGGSPQQRIAAVRALVRMEIPEAVGPLVEAAYGSDAALRRGAMEGLSALATEGKIDLAPILVALLRNPDPEARRAAAQLAGSAQGHAGELGAQMIDLLRDEDWFVRERVLEALVEMQIPDLPSSIAALLDDPSPVLRRYAIYGLLQMRDPATLGAMLLAAVRDEDWWVREQAVLAIAALGDARAIPYLEALLRERADLRVSVLEALVALGAHATVVEAAESMLSDEDASLRAAMLAHLGNVRGGEKAGFYVQACVGDPVPAIAKAARELMGRWKMSPDREAASAVGLLDRLLVAAARQEADDVILHSGRPPYSKRHGIVAPLARAELSEAELRAMLLPLLSAAHQQQFAQGHDVDASYEVPGFELRFRVNVFRQGSSIAAVLRRIAGTVPELDTLGLPQVVKSFADYPHGLVLVGGPTGSGKSTTLAALIGTINRNEAQHIVTIEDPIEVMHASRASIVNQREVGTHAPSFADALRSILRQDPDVILVGELRDVTTMEFALQAAETGHLVFATVHTVSAPASIDRLVHAFPGKQQPVVRSMLADSLRAVCCQQLLRRIDAQGGRVLACEVLVANDAVANLVRKDKCFQLPSVMVTSREQGMVQMDEDLLRLVTQRIVSPEEALSKSVDTANFAASLAQAGFLSQEDARTIRGAPPKPAAAEPGAARPRTSLEPPAPAAKRS